MTVWIALLRAINVGGTGKLPMAHLRALAADQGLDNPRTHLASGNLLFRSELPEPDILNRLETGLARIMNTSPGVVLRTACEMARLSAALPFADMPGDRVGILFCPAGEIPIAKGQTSETITTALDHTIVHFPDGMGRARLTFTGGTMRNRNTVMALAALAQNSESWSPARGGT